MNHIAQEILMHYGMPRRSGRYPWGSGEDPYQRTGSFVSWVKELRKQGKSEKEIAEEMGCSSTTSFRSQYSNAVNQLRVYEADRAKSMLSDGYSKAEIARAMGKNESSIRLLLDDTKVAKMNEVQTIVNFLKEQVDTKGMIDVGTGVEREMGISREKMNAVLNVLAADGYIAYGGGVPQATNPGRQTIIKVLCPPDIVPSEGKKSPKEIYDYENVHSVKEYKVRQDEDGNDIVEKGFVYPKSMDSSRMEVKYAEEGGIQKDGVVEIRRNVPDLSLGESHYAQVRILVDDTHYIKGMAVYADDLPDGVDVRFNTNKPVGTPLEKVLKPIKDDKGNPFGSLIKEDGGQYTYEDEHGERQLGLINKRSDEGDWGDWSDSLSSQFLGKQSQQLINKQLNLAISEKQEELDSILSLTNPTVKKEMLESFADDCDAAAVHLQAAALPRQKYQVILPVPSMKETEIYAPRYEDGETVALIRYPHGGTFEIPILRVNNKQADAKNLVGNTPSDVVCINKAVADRLSGADFDGDTVMVIPCNSDKSKVKITSTKALEDLQGFDAKIEYAERPGMKYMKYKVDTGKIDKNGKPIMHEVDHTQIEMGKISNLITDMTLQGATPDELARAVRHSMVVIDAGKHKLDYKRSEEDNGIAALKKRYQGRLDDDGKYHEGAATLLSRSKHEEAITKRRGSPKINEKGKDWYDPTQPEGALVYKQVVEEYTDKAGKTKQRMQKVPLMSITTDAHKLSTGTPQEEAYADYANKLKAMANTARLEQAHTGKIQYSASANAAYRKEYDSLLAQLNVALLNAPRERQAQLAANAVIRARKQSNPDMTGKEIKKLGQIELTRARSRFGAARTPVKISDREWEAVQAGAISETTLKKIIRNTDIDNLRSLATPRAATTLSQAKQTKIKTMQLSGYSMSEIAKAVGCSTSTVSDYIRGKE